MRKKCQDDMLCISTAKLVTKPSHPSEVDTLTKELASLREKLRLQKASGPPTPAPTKPAGTAPTPPGTRVLAAPPTSTRTRKPRISTPTPRAASTAAPYPSCC